ncbi:MAG: hypothetical protein KAI38_00710, partial [Candidatus Latescibacteria bacterium]|nr:hypothetical protein [Candidatus Latescibacterota bacterium]
ISNATNILSLTGQLPCMIHESAQNPLILWFSYVFWITNFNLRKARQKPEAGRILQDLVNDPGARAQERNTSHSRRLEKKIDNRSLSRYI